MRLLFLLLCLCMPATAQTGSCPFAQLTASDLPYDAGGTVLLQWPASPFDGPGARYAVYASTTPEGPWLKTLDFAAGTHRSSDLKLPFWAWRAEKNTHAVKVDLARFFSPLNATRKQADKYLSGTTFYFKAAALGPTGQTAESAVVSAMAPGNWFCLPRLNNLLYALTLLAGFLWFIKHAKRGGSKLRRLPGLDAIDKAVCRAAETGRPVLFLTGRRDVSSMSTVAGISILGVVAEKTARLGAELKVPHIDPLTMTVCQEVTRQAYAQAGKPEAYKSDSNFFLSSEQFAYTAGVDGLIAREKPAVCIYTGYYYAESLLLAEVGAGVGAMQIAATDAEPQLPFFFASCDYTLMGEELYAAGAYLTQDPAAAGTLRWQDAGKTAVIVAIAATAAAAAMGTFFGWPEFVRAALDLLGSF